MLSDHDAIYCVRNVKCEKKPPETILCRDYTNYTVENLQQELQNTDFSSVFSETNPNKSWKSLKSILLRIFNNNAPLITKRVKGKKSPWLNRYIKSEMNLRDSLNRKFRKSRSEADFNTYKHQRNKVNAMVRKAKNKHYKTLLSESTGDQKRFWKILKRIFPTKEVVANAKSFFIDGVLESRPAKIASSFCKFFSNMAEAVKKKSIRLKDFVWS